MQMADRFSNLNAIIRNPCIYLFVESPNCLLIRVNSIQDEFFLEGGGSFQHTYHARHSHDFNVCMAVHIFDCLQFILL